MSILLKSSLYKSHFLDFHPNIPAYFLRQFHQNYTTIFFIVWYMWFFQIIFFVLISICYLFKDYIRIVIWSSQFSKHFLHKNIFQSKSQDQNIFFFKHWNLCDNLLEVMIVIPCSSYYILFWPTNYFIIHFSIGIFL